MTDQQRRIITAIKGLISLIFGLRDLVQQQQRHIALQDQSQSVIQQSVVDLKVENEQLKETVSTLQSKLVEAMSQGESTSEELQAQMNANASLNAALIERDMALKAKDQEIADLAEKLSSSSSELPAANPELENLIQLANQLTEELTAPAALMVEPVTEMVVEAAVEPVVETPVVEAVAETPVVAEPVVEAAIETPVVVEAPSVDAEIEQLLAESAEVIAAD